MIEGRIAFFNISSSNQLPPLFSTSLLLPPPPPPNSPGVPREPEDADQEEHVHRDQRHVPSLLEEGEGHEHGEDGENEGDENSGADGLEGRLLDDSVGVAEVDPGLLQPRHRVPERGRALLVPENLGPAVVGIGPSEIVRVKEGPDVGGRDGQGRGPGTEGAEGGGDAEAEGEEGVGGGGELGKEEGEGGGNEREGEEGRSV